MITLGIETSCDDTAAAVLDGEGNVLSNIVLGQDEIHRRFGGIVPELASRRHLESISSVIDEALGKASLKLSDIDLIAATQGPGLIGSLIVGFSYAKSLAYALSKPFVGVDHMTGHILSAFLEEHTPSFPFISLIVSGGTSALYQADGFLQFSLLGRTRDDAAGEAFDKVARLFKLGYPGGPIISKLAEEGASSEFVFPRAWLADNSLDFSFSGLKTSVMNHYNKCIQAKKEIHLPELCHGFQEAVVDVLVEKTILASEQNAIDTIVLGGGVSANMALRNRMSKRCSQQGKKLFLPSIKNCTDNAAMIAFSGLKRFQAGFSASQDDDVFSRSQLGQ